MQQEQESVPKRDLDDSGCVQDAPSPMKSHRGSRSQGQQNGYVGRAQLLDLSDDVLLDILQYCSPMDLKALGYSCPRLGMLIRDRSLWQRVNALGSPTGQRRLQWMLANTLHAGTERLLIEGYAYTYPGCMGHSTKSEPDNDTDGPEDLACSSRQADDAAGPSRDNEPERGAEPPYPLHRQHARLHISAHPLPRFSMSPSWSEEYMSEEGGASPGASSAAPGAPAAPGSSPGQCPGPVFSLTPALLSKLRARCPNLAQLTLKGCHINCNAISINQLPRTLKKLSLQGVKCFNMPMDKSFLFKIQDYLPDLEELDLSECEWMEPATLLPLSKMEKLQTLIMRDCPKMSEFVAYASLATRYGFRALRRVDLRGSPVGDSEVSALGWLHHLSELRLSVSAQSRSQPHTHPKRAARYYTELQPWELQEPCYFAERAPSVESDMARRGSTSSEELSRQVMVMKERIQGHRDKDDLEVYSSSDESVVVQPDDTPTIVIDSEDNDEQEASDGEKDEEQEEDEEIVEEVEESEEESEQDNSNSKRYRLRSSHVADNSIETSDSLGTPGPSKRKKVESNSEKNTPNSKRVSKKQDTSIRRSSRHRESVTSKNSPKSTESNTRTTPKNVDKDSSKKNNSNKYDESRKSNTSKKNCTNTIETPRNSRVTRSNPNPKSTPTPNTGKENPKNTPTPSKATTSKPEDTPTNSSNTRKGNAKNTTPTTSNATTSKTDTPIRKSLRSSSKPNNKDDKDKNKEIDDSNANNKRGNKTNPTPEDKTNAKTGKRKAERDPNSSEDITPPKRPTYLTRSAAVNEGASTSKGDAGGDKSTPKGKGKGKKSPPRTRASKRNSSRNKGDSSDEDYDGPKEEPEAAAQEAPREEHMIRFRASCPPELVRLPFVPLPGGEDDPLPPPHQDRQLEPSHHLLYVNVGERFHAVYRLAPNRPAFGGMRSRARVSNLRSLFGTQPPRVDPAAMITDAAIRAFGRSDAEDMNYVLIGPNGLRQPRDDGVYNRLIGPGGQNLPANQRPDRVALRTLTVTGFSLVTDRSLAHLAQAAPHLTHLDVRGTAVTEAGVENFRALRPECTVLYGPFTNDEGTGER